MSADAETPRRCPTCSVPVGAADAFCENCGSSLVPDASEHASPDPQVAGLGAVGREQVEAGAEIGGVDADSVQFDAAALGPPRRPGLVVLDVDLDSVAGTCSACGGSIAPDGYCEQCGTPAPRPRDHWLERPVGWVALSCDRGIRHVINQDGAAVGALPEPGSFAALVVCDGVSSAARSEVASLGAARAARDVLVAPRPTAVHLVARPAEPVVPAESAVAAVPAEAPTALPQPVEEPDPAPAAPPSIVPVPPGEIPAADAPADPAADAPADPPADQEHAAGSSAVQSRASVLASAMRAAGAAAQEVACAAASDPPERNPPACTFAAAVIDESVLVAGWVGDSRVYWLPDDGAALQLSEDDSMAGEAIRHGLPRADAERSPHAHSITRWLGIDAPDATPRTAVRRIDSPAWVLVCSDGLWNYCSEAAEMRDLVRQTEGEVGQDVAGIAEALVAWAIEQGGHDNIAVALARVG